MKTNNFKFDIGETVIYKGDFHEIVSRWKYDPDTHKARGRKYKTGTRLYNVSGSGDIIPEQYLFNPYKAV